MKKVQKKSSLNFMFSTGNLDVFWGKFTAELVLKSFSGGNDSLEPPVLGLSNSLLYGLEKLIEL